MAWFASLLGSVGSTAGTAGTAVAGAAKTAAPSLMKGLSSGLGQTGVGQAAGFQQIPFSDVATKGFKTTSVTSPTSTIWTKVGESIGQLAGTLGGETSLGKGIRGTRELSDLAGGKTSVGDALWNLAQISRGSEGEKPTRTKSPTYEDINRITAQPPSLHQQQPPTAGFKRRRAAMKEKRTESDESLASYLNSLFPQ